MKPFRDTALRTLAPALLLVGACHNHHDQVSSGSNWLACDALVDCSSDDAVACNDGYCVDVDGNRIAALPASSPAGSAGAAGGAGSAGAAGGAGSAGSVGTAGVAGAAGGVTSGAGGAAGTSANPLQVSAQQYQGVWIFEYAPDASDNALHAGIARIEGGCLFIGDAVVVWHASRADDAQRAVADALAGIELEVTLGGGGVSLAEGTTLDDLPTAINDHCDASEVWFAADTPAGFRVSSDAGVGTAPDGYGEPCEAFLDGTTSCNDGLSCRPGNEVYDAAPEPMLCTLRCEAAVECPSKWVDHCGELRRCKAGICGWELCD